jgi:2-isopropylmalate synthase
VGIDADISTASLKAVVSAVNRAVRTETGDRELAAV